MPFIYLSPSVREDNQYIVGGTEEYYMNRIADAMIPHLRAGGILFARNNPGNSLSQVIAQSNAGSYDLHLALHSSSSPEEFRGVLRGPDVYFYTASERGRKAAELIAENLKTIYPDPGLVTVIPITTHAELRKTGAIAVLVEIAYHDNYEDAAWIRDHIDEIGKNLAQSVVQYLEIAA